MMPPFDKAAVTHPVPKRLHVIWVGSPPPAHVEKVWEIWEKALPDDWTIFTWTDGSVNSHPALGRAARQARKMGQNWRGVADILRVWVLALYGGVYIDSDCLPTAQHVEGMVNRERLSSRLAGRSAWMGDSPGTEAKAENVRPNGFLGFPAAHPMLEAVAHRAEEQMRRGVTNEHFVAGPRTWAAVYAELGADQRPIIDRNFLVTGDPAQTLTNGRGATLVRRMVDGDATLDTAVLAKMFPGMTGVHP